MWAQDTSARTELLQDVQRQLSEAKEQLTESRSANLAIQAERSRMLEQSVKGSEACAELQMRLELQHRLTEQLRAELDAETAEKQNWADACSQLQLISESRMQSQGPAPTLDLNDLGISIQTDAMGRPGSKLKQALVGVASHVTEEPRLVCQQASHQTATAQIPGPSCDHQAHPDELVETIPLLPPPKVISVVGDESSSLGLSPCGSPSASASTGMSARARPSSDASHDTSRKMRVHYLDASLDTELQRGASDDVPSRVPLHGGFHRQDLGPNLVNADNGALEREPLACPSILPAPVFDRAPPLQAMPRWAIANGVNAHAVHYLRKSERMPTT